MGPLARKALAFAKEVAAAEDDTLKERVEIEELLRVTELRADNLKAELVDAAETNRRLREAAVEIAAERQELFARCARNKARADLVKAFLGSCARYQWKDPEGRPIEDSPEFVALRDAFSDTPPGTLTAVPRAIAEKAAMRAHDRHAGIEAGAHRGS